MKSEDFRGADADDEYRSRGGPLVVEDYRTVLPITDRFVQAAQQAGYPLTKDYNGAEQEGVAYSQMTRDHRFRASTAQTFLAQAKGRSNLEVKTEAQTGQLLFEGTKCVGVPISARRALSGSPRGTGSHRLSRCGQLTPYFTNFGDWPGSSSAIHWRRRPA